MNNFRIQEKELFKSVKDRYSSPGCVKHYASYALKGLVPPEIAMIKKYMKPPAEILDVGCGAGREAIELAKLGYRVTGMDVASKLLNIGKQLSKKLKLNIKFKTGNGKTLNFPSRHFDYVLLIGQMIHHVPRKENRTILYQECARVLKPSGIIILTFHDFEILKTHSMWGGNKPTDPRAIKKEKKFSILEPGDTFVNQQYGGGKEDTIFGFSHNFNRNEIENEIVESGLEIVNRDDFYSICGQQDEFWKPTKILILKRKK